MGWVIIHPIFVSTKEPVYNFIKKKVFVVKYKKITIRGLYVETVDIS